MPHIEETITIHAPAEAVWALAGDPGSIADWHPMLSGAAFDGERRTCTTPDGQQLVERIVDHSDDERCYSYELVEGPVPVTSYRSMLCVSGHGDHSHVAWVANFTTAAPDEEPRVAEVVGQLYRDGLAALRERLEASAA